MHSGASSTTATTPPLDPPVPSVDWAAADVRTETVQLRSDLAAGHIELRVTNGADAALTVVRATYASSRWTEPLVREDDAAIPPVLRRNLRLQLPEPTCDGAPIEHLATLELADGTTLEQVPADPSASSSGSAATPATCAGSSGRWQR